VPGFSRSQSRSARFFRLLEDLLRTGELAPEMTKSPPIMSMMLYNGKPRWEPLWLSDPEVAWGDLLRGPLPVDPANLVGLLGELERSRTAEAIDRCVARLAAVLAGPQDRGLRRSFTAFLRRSLLPARFPGAEIPALEELEEVRPMLRETVIEWTQQWKAEGLAAGLAEGLERGRRHEAGLLIQLLEQKFGPLPDEERAKIESAAADRLLEWAERLLAADSLGEVLAS
jgi:hypothetical protein